MKKHENMHSDIQQKIEKVTDHLVKGQEKQKSQTSEALQIFNDALNSSLSAIVLTDLRGTITYTNQAYLALFRIPNDDLVLGKSVYEVFADGERKENPASKDLGVGRDFPGEAELRRDDGSSFIANVTSSPINDRSGKTVGCMLSFVDISTRKLVEREKELLNRELEQKNRDLEQIVYVASHDLRSPLVNVQGFSRELEHSIRDLNGILSGLTLPQTQREQISMIMDEDIQESLRFILTSVSKMDKLLAGLLRLSRLGRAALHMEKLDMNKLVSGITAALEYQIKEASADVSIEDLPSCIGDETQVGQVFTNLVDNAIKYRDPDKPLLIRISGRCGKNECVYTVEDNGKGIDPGHQEKIFEIFHRLTPDIGTGEGLGLTIVRRILDKHRGRVRVESSPGQGSRFFIHLPTRHESKKEYQ